MLPSDIRWIKNWFSFKCQYVAKSKTDESHVAVVLLLLFWSLFILLLTVVCFKEVCSSFYNRLILFIVLCEDNHFNIGPFSYWYRWIVEAELGVSGSPCLTSKVHREEQQVV